ncbi:MAG: polysaccharide deacetylase family protein [Patescibacteria group bacterium]|nr:polysaccharide deacetylase family protein [Patescibacteria group bacterium]
MIISLVLFAGMLFAVSISAREPMASTTPSLKEVALTFDDGPYGTSTQAVLDILQKEDIHATFFLIGRNVEKYSSLTKEEVNDGELIGNHTYDHPKNLPLMTLAHIRSEISKTDTAISSSTGIHTKFFRPPYGRITNRVRGELHKEGYTIVMWNTDPRDWDYKGAPSDAIVNRILSHLKDRMVIDLHDGRDTHVGYPRDNLIKALPILIDKLKADGYTFVTVDKLKGNFIQ